MQHRKSVDNPFRPAIRLPLLPTADLTSPRGSASSSESSTPEPSTPDQLLIEYCFDDVSRKRALLQHLVLVKAEYLFDSDVNISDVTMGTKRKFKQYIHISGMCVVQIRDENGFFW